jgi:hypothetical protein
MKEAVLLRNGDWSVVWQVFLQLPGFGTEVA